MGGRGGERRGGLFPQLGSMGPAVEEGREGEKGKEGSLGWGVQTLLFSTLSTGIRVACHPHFRFDTHLSPSHSAPLTNVLATTCSHNS